MKQPLWKYLVSWEALLIYPLGLAWLCWPWASHFVSYFWLIIAVAVLIAELLSYLKTKKTVSDNIRQQMKDDPIRFWIMNAIWLAFAITLVGHFMTRGV